MNLPDRIIVYDGQCFLCNQWLRFLPPRDPQMLYRFCPRQTATGAALLQHHGLDPVDPKSFLYVECGRGWTGTSAIIRILAGLGGAWRFTMLLLLIPRALRDPFYSLLSRNRYRWRGKAAACIVPDAALRARFVEWPDAAPTLPPAALGRVHTSGRNAAMGMPLT
jgi:predicted DCC family thiol-disulfide oxidoreductase YuxK